MVGKPVVKGTRIPNEIVLERLAEDLDTKALFADYPRLTEEDVKACLAYAEEVVEGEECFLLPKNSDHPLYEISLRWKR
jgi:uncharacterized protein (DUF433 family)